jgi:hypothetical protein
MDTIGGAPAHPLLVHVPVVLLPLAALGVIVMLIKPAWHRRYRWAVLTIGAVGAIGAIWSASAGEDLEGRLRRAGERNTWEDHAEAGETARNVAILFAILLAAYVLIPWYLERRDRARQAKVDAPVASPSAVPRWAMIGLSVLVLAGAVGSVATVIDAGHSGAKSVWEEDGG